MEQSTTDLMSRRNCLDVLISECPCEGLGCPICDLLCEEYAVTSSMLVSRIGVPMLKLWETLSLN